MTQIDASLPPAWRRLLVIELDDVRKQLSRRMLRGTAERAEIPFIINNADLPIRVVRCHQAPGSAITDISPQRIHHRTYSRDIVET